MRISIGSRIFLALTAISIFVLALSAGVTRWSFQRDFLGYVAVQERETLTETAASLAVIYRQNDGWEGIRDDPHRWRELLRRNSPAGPPDARPGPPPDGPPGRDANLRRTGPPGGPQGRPPAHDPFGFGRRVSLVDADGSVVLGSPDLSGSDLSVPVIVNGNTVGYVRIAARQQLTSPLDQEFARKLDRSIALVAFAAIVIAAFMAAVISRHLTRPIQTLANGARAISGGDLDTRIPESRNDELGELAREFNHLAATLEQNRQARRRWVADIAHELRTPLAILRCELDAIEDGIRPFDAATRRSLQSETARLTGLVQELHDLSTYDDGGQSYVFERLDLVELLQGVVGGAETRLTDAGIKLELHLGENPLFVSGDAARLERVLVNLVENTLRYTDRPGRFVVRCTERNGKAIIECEDSPPGVPEEALPRLFNRLFRVDDSRSRETGGSGLGLAICKAIVSAHGGRIDALASDIGGLLIRIEIPIVSANPGQQ